jgi:Mg/Co/Ni transporter MgtE
LSLAERLLRRLAEDHPIEAAGLLGSQPPDEAASILARLPEDAAAALVGKMAPASATAALARLPPAMGAKLLARLPAEPAAALLRRLEPSPREALLAALPDAGSVRLLLALPEGTAGTLMDPNVLAVPVDVDLDEARRRVGRHSSQLALELYVVDRAQRLVGAVDLREVLDASRRGPLAELVREQEPLPATADAATIAAHPAWAERGSLPVVDERGLFLGALRAERLRRLAQETQRGRSQAGTETVAALGELYWLGLSGLFTGLARRPEMDREEEEER